MFPFSWASYIREILAQRKFSEQIERRAHPAARRPRDVGELNPVHQAGEVEVS